MSITVNEAGRRGGLTVLARYGCKHFSKIGKQGQKILRKLHPGMAVSWGAQGGRPRKSNLDNMGGQDKNNKRGGADPPHNLIPHQSNYRHSMDEQQDIDGQEPKSLSK